jgi:DNA-binding LacI/PurR family transcriptional regulator
MQPSLTSIEQFGFDIGKTATEILLDLVAHGDTHTAVPYKNNVLETRLYVRESSKKS